MTDNETLTQYLLETGEYLRQQGSLADTNCMLNLATRLLPQGDHYMDFWLAIFRAVSKDLSPLLVYPLLENNLDKLNQRLGEVLEIWAYDTLIMAGLRLCHSSSRTNLH